MAEPVVVPPGVPEAPRDRFLRELHDAILREDAADARRIPAEVRDRRTQLELERLDHWLPATDDPLDRSRRIVGAWRY